MVPSGPACGDGKLNQPSEECDDNNSVPGDGCNGICKVEPNFTCPTPGQPCIPTFKCGNGKIEPGEVCDDGNTLANDGCSADCTVQSASYICPTPGQPCTRVDFCGDKRVKGDENCDDGNRLGLPGSWQSLQTCQCLRGRDPERRRAMRRWQHQGRRRLFGRLQVHGVGLPMSHARQALPGHEQVWRRNRHRY
jgi:cysteine-rich repeat protein